MQTEKSQRRFSESKKSGRDSKRQNIDWNKFVRQEEWEDRENDFLDSSDEVNMVTDFILSEVHIAEEDYVVFSDSYAP